MELVVTIVVLAIALTGLILMLSRGVGRNADTLVETRAAALAQSYLDEILAKRFDENVSSNGIPPCRSNCTTAVNFGLDGGETDRQEYDDVDDYHGLDEGYFLATPLLGAEGNERLGYENFRAQVSVRYLDTGIGGLEEALGVTADDLDDDQDAKLITLTISHSSYPTGWQFSAYKANF